MKKNVLLCALALGSLSANAQIFESQGFEQSSPYANWELDNYQSFSDQSYSCTGVGTIYSTMHEEENLIVGTATYTSPNQSNETDLLVSFNYSTSPYEDNPINGNMVVEYSTDGGVSYVLLGQVDFTEPITCENYTTTIPAADLPSGSDFKFRVTSNHVDGIWFLLLDDVILEQVAQAECASNVTIEELKSGCGNLGAKVSWDAAVYALSYDVTIGTTSGASDILNENTTDTEIVFDTDISTTYYVNVVPKNSQTTATGCTEETFTTSSDLCYCESVPTSVDGNGISQIEFASAGQTLTQGTDTYVDHTAIPVIAYKGMFNQVNLTFETGYTYNTNIWVDLNNDYLFSSDELLYQGESTSDNPTVLNTSFTLPSSLADGNYRMRIGTADFGQMTPNSCYTGDYGVTMDFVLNVEAGPCAILEATAAISESCESNEFSVVVEVSSLGSGDNTITDGITSFTATTVGESFTFGPYPSDEVVNITTSQDAATDTCNTNLGTFTYHCPAIGESCGTAIDIASLPYTTTDDTANYYDYVDMLDNSVVCNANYTTGNDVFYTFTPSVDMNIDVSMTYLTESWTGVQILNGCYDDASTTCIGSSSDSTTGDQLIENVAVTAGTTYYIWVSTWANPQTVGYTLTVSENTTGTVSHELSGLKIYPNPVADVLTISNDTAISTIEVFDINGRRLLNEVVNTTSATINVSSFAAGTYFVKVTADGKTATQQVVVK